MQDAKDRGQGMIDKNIMDQGLGTIQDEGFESNQDSDFSGEEEKDDGAK